MHRACASGDVQRLKKLLDTKLENGLDPDARDAFRRTPLMRAAENGHLKCLKLLLEEEVDVNASDKYGRCALSLAARKGHDDIMEILLKAKADVNHTDNHGNSAFSIAKIAQCRPHNRKACKKLLLDAGAPYQYYNTIDNKEKRETEMHRACVSGDVQCLKKLLDTKLENGLDPDARDADHYTPLMRAAENGHLQCLKLLLEEEIDVNAVNVFGRSALMLAAKNGHQPCMEKLLEAGADVNATDNKGYYALTIANRQCPNIHRSACKKLLVDAGAEFHQEEIIAHKYQRQISDVLNKDDEKKEPGDQPGPVVDYESKLPSGDLGHKESQNKDVEKNERSDENVPARGFDESTQPCLHLGHEKSQNELKEENGLACSAKGSGQETLDVCNFANVRRVTDGNKESHKKYEEKNEGSDEAVPVCDFHESKQRSLDLGHKKSQNEYEEKYERSDETVPVCGFHESNQPSVGHKKSQNELKEQNDLACSAMGSGPESLDVYNFANVRRVTDGNKESHDKYEEKKKPGDENVPDCDESKQPMKEENGLACSAKGSGPGSLDVYNFANARRVTDGNKESHKKYEEKNERSDKNVPVCDIHKSKVPSLGLGHKKSQIEYEDKNERNDETVPVCGFDESNQTSVGHKESQNELKEENDLACSAKGSRQESLDVYNLTNAGRVNVGNKESHEKYEEKKKPSDENVPVCDESKQPSLFLALKESQNEWTEDCAAAVLPSQALGSIDAMAVFPDPMLPQSTLQHKGGPAVSLKQRIYNSSPANNSVKGKCLGSARRYKKRWSISTLRSQSMKQKCRGNAPGSNCAKQRMPSTILCSNSKQRCTGRAIASNSMLGRWLDGAPGSNCMKRRMASNVPRSKCSKRWPGNASIFNSVKKRRPHRALRSNSMKEQSPRISSISNCVTKKSPSSASMSNSSSNVATPKSAKQRWKRRQSGNGPEIPQDAVIQNEDALEEPPDPIMGRRDAPVVLQDPTVQAPSAVIRDPIPRASDARTVPPSPIMGTGNTPAVPQDPTVRRRHAPIMHSRDGPAVPQHPILQRGDALEVPRDPVMGRRNALAVPQDPLVLRRDVLAMILDLIVPMGNVLGVPENLAQNVGNPLTVLTECLEPQHLQMITMSDSPSTLLEECELDIHL